MIKLLRCICKFFYRIGVKMRIINLFLMVVLMLFSFNVLSIKYELKSFNEFDAHCIEFDPKETIAVFDIDNTLVRQKHILLDENNDLALEYSDFCEKLIQKTNMNVMKFWNYLRDKIHPSFPKHYIWVEEQIPSFIKKLQHEGVPVITCTASTLIEGDERIKLLNEAGIDLTKHFIDIHVFPFFYSNNFFHPGHTSSKNKAEKIDEVINVLNVKRLENSQYPIKTVLFFDNREDQAEFVSNKVKSVHNVHSFYYTFIKHSLDVDEVYEEVKHIN
jgi:uncharacterized protein YqgV (UPF0045/DUF77 family)